MSGPSLHADTPSALPAGTRLGEFELLSLLGVGGFGIVYLAFDHALEREVAVKEYMPASLAGRTETMHVSLRSQSDAETFALGLKSFVNEARLLARFDHPSLLKVHRFWEANGTAYMAMPVMRGHTVKEVRAGMQSPPDEAWLRALLEPLLGAIERLHSEGVYHRDIAPDNIQIEPGGHPVLLDFGAARRVISDKSQALTAILKPAYAPIEQYAEAGSVKQGPWTDIYALGATLHYLMLGRPPPPATARAVHDDASALTPQSLPHCSQNFLHIVNWMLAPRPSDRPQNVAALREVLDGRALPPQRRAPEPMASEWDRTVILPPASAPGAAGAVQTPLDDDQATVLIPASTLPTGRVPVQPQAAVSQALPRPPAAPVGPADSVSMRAQPPLPASGPGPGPAPAPAPAATAAAALPPAAPAAPVLLAASASGAAPRSRLLPVALGVGAVVVVATALALWPRSPVVVAVAPAASAAAPVQAPAASAAQAEAATAAPASAVPESTIATVVVPAATATQTGAGPALSTLPHPGATPATTLVTARPARQTAVPRNASAAPAVQPVAPPSEPVAEAAPAPLLPAAPPPAQTEAAKPVALGPEAKCGGRNPLAYFVCMERECLRAEMMPHADCLKWRRAARSE